MPPVQTNSIQPPMSKRARLSDTAALPVSTASSTPFVPSQTNPFVYDLISKPSVFSSRGAKPTRYTTKVTMSIPSEEEECPLTLDSIASSKLPCLPDTPFLTNRPLHSKLTLQCGHSFSAMNLIYSFCKNSMTCPCCRAGEDVKADTTCLPSHFKSLLKARIQQTLETERRQDDSREYQEVLDSLSMFGVTIPYEALGINGNLSIVANFHDIPPMTEAGQNSRPVFAFSNIVQPRRENGQITMVPRGPLRALTHVAHMGINAIQLSVVLSMQGMGDVTIDSTHITRLPDIHDQNAPMRLMIPGATSSSVTHNGQFQVLVQLQRNEDSTPATSFTVLFSRAGAFFVLDTISWSPGTDSLEFISSNTSLAAML